MAPEYVLFKKWRRSQVFMYPRKSESMDKLTQNILPQSHSDNPNIPSCFGNLLTSKYVLTAATCFMDMKKISKTEQNWKEKFLSGDFLKSGIENLIFVQVTYRNFKFLYELLSSIMISIKENHSWQI